MMKAKPFSDIFRDYQTCRYKPLLPSETVLSTEPRFHEAALDVSGDGVTRADPAVEGRAGNLVRLTTGDAAGDDAP